MEEYKAILAKRVSYMAWVSALLMVSILLIAFGFVIGVLKFEFGFAEQPELANSLRDAAWEAQRTITASESNLKSIISDGQLLPEVKGISIENNLVASTQAIEAFNAKVDGLARTAAAADDEILGAFLTSKRVLIALVGLFVAVVLKLLIELYKYNAHLRSHYLAIHDALLLDGAKFNATTFERTIKALSPQLKIGAVKAAYETLVDRVSAGRSDPKT